MSRIIELNSDNLMDYGLFCIKKPDNPGFQRKSAWIVKRFEEGMKIKYVLNSEEKPIAYLEYVPGKYVWRPINAPDYMVIHCISIDRKENRGQGYAQDLIDECIREAKQKGLRGVAVMTSEGSWFPDSRIFEKIDFKQVDKKGKYQLMANSFSDTQLPKFIDWNKNLKDYEGWQIFYANQCPALFKSLNDLPQIAKNYDIKLNMKVLNSPEESQNAPTPSGLFALIHDGKLLNMHYTSGTRFKSLIKKELGLQ